MVCRCNSAAEHDARAEAQRAQSQRYNEDKLRKENAQLKATIDRMSVKPFEYEVLDTEYVDGAHLVMKVKYKSCLDCVYEGTKVMVFLNTSPLEALKWKKIDPHFRGREKKPGEAPSPDARFPADEFGWEDAVKYACSHTVRRSKD